METILQNLSTYVKNNLYDDKYGAFFSVVNRNKDDIVTEDKTLLDITLSLLAFSKLKDFDMVKKLLRDLNQFQDKENNGYYEILDGTNIVQEVGTVKTASIQILTEYAKYVVGKQLNYPDLLSLAEKNIVKFVERYMAKNNASILTNDWNDVVDSKIKLKDISIILYVVNKINYQEFIPNLSELLRKFIDTNKGAHSELTTNYTPIQSSGKKLSDMSLMMLAINSMKSALKKEFLEVIDDTLNFINHYYRHPLTKGFWDKSDKEGKISVNVISTYYQKSESPFPIKSMVSHSLFLLALKDLEKNQKFPLLEILKQDTKEQLIHFYDSKNGGLNYGQGNWFSTPTNPTVPIARHVMVPNYTKGAFYVGNTAYLPLHEKITTLQLLGILVFDEKDHFEKVIFENKSYHSYSFSKAEKNIIKTPVSGKLTNHHIDVEKYKEWSHKTLSGFSYGLTAYRSPLGVKSDKTPQNFSALHVIADMTLLGEPSPHQDELETSLLACQNKDGGFAEQPSLLSELFTTYCVVATELILGRQNYDVEKCIQFIKECQNADGGFGNAPGYPSDTWHTNFGAVTLHLLNAEPLDKERLIQYLLHCQNEDGGFSIIPRGISEAFSTFRCIDSLLVQGVDIPNRKQVVQWLHDLQDKSGGFLYQKNKVVSFVGSYHAIGALYLLGELPYEVEKAQEWLAQHQSRDGGFSRALGAPSDTTDEGFISIHASYMLEQKIDPYWVAIIT